MLTHRADAALWLCGVVGLITAWFGLVPLTSLFPS